MGLELVSGADFDRILRSALDLSPADSLDSLRRLVS